MYLHKYKQISTYKSKRYASHFPYKRIYIFCLDFIFITFLSPNSLISHSIHKNFVNTGFFIFFFLFYYYFFFAFIFNAFKWVFIFVIFIVFINVSYNVRIFFIFILTLTLNHLKFFCTSTYVNFAICVKP